LQTRIGLKRLLGGRPQAVPFNQNRLCRLTVAARFITGVVVPVDGGFSAYSGV
jgi:hypothetical protein